MLHCTAATSLWCGLFIAAIAALDFNPGYNPILRRQPFRSRRVVSVVPGRFSPAAEQIFVYMLRYCFFGYADTRHADAAAHAV